MKYFVYCRKSEEAEDRQVMSLQSQSKEIDRLLSAGSDIEIVQRFEEAFSAKKPGRPVFDEMIRRIEKGEAEGIIAWHPDRLARNSIDGGRIIYLLDEGKLTNMRFCSYTFENSSEGKFMLSIVFSYSKYYVDNLSTNVIRGLNEKVSRGWLPNSAPIGYRNCKETSTIVPNGEHFAAIRRMFDLLLTGNHTVAEIHRIVWEEWGYTTPIVKTQGGKRLARSSLYRLFSNPFYAGYLVWNGQLHPGSHKPMVSKSEFQRVQALLGNVSLPRPKRKSFAYRGVFTCGACGLGVTAEYKRKKSGREYVYYHCTRVHRTPRCTQPSIEEKELDRQVVDFLKRLTIPPSVSEILDGIFNAEKPNLVNEKAKATEKLSRGVASLKKQLSNLTDLRIREVLTDQEFAAKRQNLQLELGKAEECMAKVEGEIVTFEPLQIIQILLRRAEFWFATADDCLKRQILKILCSNPVIQDKKARFQARKPLVDVEQFLTFLGQRGVVDDVRTTSTNSSSEFEKCADLATSKELIKLAAEARELIEQIEPAILSGFDNRR